MEQLWLSQPEYKKLILCYLTVLARTITFETAAIHLCMHSTLMVVVMETDTPMDILNNGMF